jgi:hypothetical protein
VVVGAAGDSEAATAPGVPGGGAASGGVPRPVRLAALAPFGFTQGMQGGGSLPPRDTPRRSRRALRRRAPSSCSSRSSAPNGSEQCGDASRPHQRQDDRIPLRSMTLSVTITA